MAVYLLHSTVPLAQPNGREVRHYLGHCEDGTFPVRFHDHLTGHRSARIVQAFLLNGGELCLGNYYPNADYEEERRMKRMGHLAHRCLVCQVNELQRELRRLRGLAGL